MAHILFGFPAFKDENFPVKNAGCCLKNLHALIEIFLFRAHLRMNNPTTWSYKPIYLINKSFKFCNITRIPKTRIAAMNDIERMVRER